MKEIEPYRGYCVTYENSSCVSWKTKAEMEQMVREGKVNWITHQSKQIMGRELQLYQAYLNLKFEDPTRSPSNTDLAFHMSQFSPEPVSRNEIARLRNQVRLKLGFRAGW